jgi:putative ABC transport system permease protein
MAVLDRKLRRDIWRLRSQALAIAGVMAAGVATLVLGMGAYQSLDETRAAYYDRQMFADVFATVRRAPERLRDEIAAVDGVAAVETRIVDAAILDLEGVAEPVSARLVSLPDEGDAELNRIYLRRGRTPDPERPDEIVVNEAFAAAHGFEPGARFAAIVGGRRRTLEIVGTALSPEFIYTLAPGALVPDDRRFAVIWMSRRALAAAFDQDGAFSDVSVKLLAGASETAVIERLDDLLAPYGGLGAYGRKDQQSHAFLDSELQQQRAMSVILPPIFLLVSAFLVNITLSRLVALEREQVGLLKALGYSSVEIGWHYLKFAIAIAVAGAAAGLGAGLWLGHGLASLYSRFFHFPFLIFHIDASVYVGAVAVTLLAAIAGAASAVRVVARLPAAVAMQAPVPPGYRRLGHASIPVRMSQSTVMILRHIVRWPLRAILTVFGISMSVAVLIAALFSQDAIEHLIDFSFFRADRMDAVVGFAVERPASALADVARLPGILTVEPVRNVAVRLSHGPISRRAGLAGRTPDADLSRIIDTDGRTVALPETGLVLTDKMAEVLDAEAGDIVRVEALEGRRRIEDVPVTAIVRSYVGMGAVMDIAAVNRLMGEGPEITAVNVKLDPRGAAGLYAAVKAMPAVSSVALQSVSLQTLRATMAENILITTGVFTALALTIAVGVAYNSARIQLSERARELVSLRVLGFTRAEVAWILLAELGLLTLAALPLGCILGYGLALAMTKGFETELFRIPLVIETSTYAWAMLAAASAALASGLAVRRRLNGLDLVEVLKSRE